LFFFTFVIFGLLNRKSGMRVRVRGFGCGHVDQLQPLRKLENNPTTANKMKQTKEQNGMLLFFAHWRHVEKKLIFVQIEFVKQHHLLVDVIQTAALRRLRIHHDNILIHLSPTNKNERSETGTTEANKEQICVLPMKATKLRGCQTTSH
jgi:hypothetical protein